MRKLKFRPKITRVKLNPEQAVLVCACYSIGVRKWGDAQNASPLNVAAVCLFAPKAVANSLYCGVVDIGLPFSVERSVDQIVS